MLADDKRKTLTEALERAQAALEEAYDISHADHEESVTAVYYDTLSYHMRWLCDALSCVDSVQRSL